jgi:lycopene beta-cyclase
LVTRLIIAGGGLAGCLAALALAGRTDLQILLVERQAGFGGNHTWSYFDTDVDPADRRLLKELVEFHWSDHEVNFPRRSRRIDIGYNSLTSAGLDRAVRSRLRPDQYRIGAAICDVTADHVTLAGGERLEADAVIDARGGMTAEGLDLRWQKFVGRVFNFGSGHRISRPIIMDATVEQHDGYRFLYFLPLSRSRLLIEDTYYSSSATLDVALIEKRVERAARKLGSGSFEVERQESGILPVVLDGDFDCFWPADDQVARLGVRGGYFHPTTSYSLPDAVANAAWLAEQSDFTPLALARLTRRRAEQLWRDRSFYRLLNRMLFRAAEPDRSYRVLEHFYRLPQGVIGRFYAARLTALDKLRILSGKPPVPIGRAIRAMRRTAA